MPKAIVVYRRASRSNFPNLFECVSYKGIRIKFKKIVVSQQFSMMILHKIVLNLYNFTKDNIPLINELYPMECCSLNLHSGCCCNRSIQLGQFL